MRDVKITEHEITYWLDYCDKKLRITGSQQMKYEIKKPWDFMNDKFDGETPEVMKFIYGMMRAKYASYKLPEGKFKFVENYFDQLVNFDPLNKYQLDKANMCIIKKIRTIKPATGIVAELEDIFVKDTTIKNRTKIIKLFDYVKKFGANKSDIDTLTQLIKPQTLF